MNCHMPRLFRGLARPVTVAPADGSAAYNTSMLLEDRAGAVWEDKEPVGRFQKPSTITEGDLITLDSSGAVFRAQYPVNKPASRDVTVPLERINDVFDPLGHLEKAFVSSSARLAWFDGYQTGVAMNVLLRREESVGRLDIGKASQVLCAHAPDRDMPRAPVQGDSLAIVYNSGEVDHYRLYGVEPLYRSGLWRLVLERG